jgi:GNAT superfamily N-acetyltransferase
MSTIELRTAGPSDAKLLLSLIRGLADYEKLAHEVVATEEGLAAQLGAVPPVAHAIVASIDGAPAGFALYFFTFSTFLGRPGLYLEDLFVLPAMRGHGIGRALLVELARRAEAKGCGRMEWSVLDWNVDAQRFYEGLGARRHQGWNLYRMNTDAIRELAR